VEYAYLGTRGRLRDRFNSRVVPNGVGAANHFFYMPGGGPTPLARQRRGVPRGALTSHTLAAEPFASREVRHVHLYAPAARGPWPLLVVLDGNDYLRRARLATIVDKLVADGRVRPLAMAFLQHGGRARVFEYACNDATLALLTERLLPFARQRVDLVRAPGGHGILGASIGGLMALYAGLRAPEIFGTVLSQSGAFTLLGVDTIAFHLVRSQPRRRLRIWMDVGHLERLRPANHRMRAALVSRGYDVGYRRYHAGHNWTAWRNDVWRGLESLFAG
jgi:enterochelin esterase-like enzyme